MESQSPAQGAAKRPVLLIAFVAVVAVGLVYWRAWVGDDAYITFRHVENFLAGHGPVFNVGERVQGFSHPLWFGLLAALTPLLGAYAAAITLGLVFTVGLFVMLGAALGGRPSGGVVFVLAASALLASRALVEYQTSGLENSLSNLLVCGLCCAVLLRSNDAPAPSTGMIAGLCGLLILDRPDHAFLCLPLLAWILVGAVRRRRIAEFAALAGALLPMVAWYAFATIYYGTPMPNPFYAKLGMERGEAFRQGMYYLRDYAAHEPLQAALIVLGLLVLFALMIADCRARRPGAGLRLCLTAGVALQLLAVISVGGDFMRGRFFVVPLVAATILLAWALVNRAAGWAERNVGWIMLAFGLLAGSIKLATEGGTVAVQRAGSSSGVWLGLLALAVIPAVWQLWGRPRMILIAPAVLACGVFLSQWDLAPRVLANSPEELVASHGIVDERMYYVPSWNENRFKPPADFPRDGRAGAWRYSGMQMRAFADKYGPFAEEHGALGLISYHAGPKVQVIDLFGLGDAFVARCPVSDSSRVAHIRRAVPEEYNRLRRDIRRLPMGHARMISKDPRLKAEIERMTDPPTPWGDAAAYALWQRVTLVTRGPIFSWERLRALPAFAFPRVGRAAPAIEKDK